MKANDSNSYLSYFTKLVDRYNNTHHHSINKNLLMLIILLWMKKSGPMNYKDIFSDLSREKIIGSFCEK